MHHPIRCLLLCTGLVLIGARHHAAEPSKEAKMKNNPNRLLKESSPYLLQHAYNPVDWHPWGEEAFAKAKKENKSRSTTRKSPN